MWWSAVVACVLPLTAGAQALDPAYSRFGFEVRTRWGQVVVGDFPRYDGEASQLPDGRRQVRIRLAAADVEMGESARYTRFARGPRFLDAARHPWVEFHSDPYPPELLHSGGPLRGTLSMHGTSRPQIFVLEPALCARPARDCDVVARGTVRRSEYGLQTWRWALLDEVRFILRVRLQEAAP